MSEETPVHTANPFAARRLRPGFVPYVFPEGSGEASRGGEHSLAGLVARLRGNRFWGEVVGPHGSGKSALVASLVGVLEAQRHRSIVVELHDGQRRMPAHVLRAAAGQAAELLVIDGYEQLLSFVRWHVCWHCRRHGIGLVVTAHRPMGLPPLVTTSANPRLAWEIVCELQRGFPPYILEDDVVAAFERHGGNLREALFQLYDVYQSRCS